ncbi:MAG: T9SS type A sorting domain-containing protein [Cyclobacteriaceae bacterium]|nr:T9SS type A sorting domain-containing protein [Cyclobacteriaceae bacterium]
MNPVLSQDLQPDWFTIIKGPHTESKPIIKPDNRGNIYSTGVLSLYDPIFQTEDGYIDTVKIDRYNNLNSTTYFTKMDENGKILFHRSIVQDGYADPKCIEIDKKGNIYLLYSFKGTLNFNNTVVSSYNSSDPHSLPSTILVKYDSLGEFLWSKAFLSGSEIFPIKIEVTKSNDIIVLADMYYNYSDSSVFIDNSTFVFTNGNPFLTHFDESGNISWLRKLTYYPSSFSLPIRYHTAVDFLIDEDESIYFCGYYEEGIYFSENDSLYSPTGSMFLVKHTSTGTIDWIKSIDSPNQTTIFPIKMLQRSESVGIIAINHSPGITFEINDFPVSQYIIATEFALDGTFQIAYDLYTANSPIADVDIDKEGNLYLLGGLIPNEIFQYEDIMVQSSVEKWFLIKFNQDKIQWAQFHGNVGMGLDLEIDNAGNIYWSGAWGCTANIFGETFVANGCSFFRGDALVSKLSSKSIYFETDRTCSGIPISFEFKFFDFTYTSTIHEFTIAIEAEDYTEPNFTHTFDNGGEKTLNLSLVDNLTRSYSRSFTFDIFELKPEIYYNNGTIYLNPLQGVTAYTWFKDNEIFTTTSHPNLKVDQSGLYYLQIQAENDCIFNSNELIIEIDELVTSIEKNKIPQVLFWPNPARHTLYVDSGDTSADILIYSLDGRSLTKKTVTGQSQIDISGLQQGIHIMRIENKSGTNYFRIVVTNPSK